MTLERTQDYRRVKKIADENPMQDGDTWNPVVSSEYIYLIEVEGEKDVGLWIFEPEENYFLMHACMGSKCRGRKAVESALDAIGWLFENTDVDAILAPIVKNFRHARIIAQRAGLKVYAENENLKAYIMTRQMYRRRERQV